MSEGSDAFRKASLETKEAVRVAVRDLAAEADKTPVGRAAKRLLRDAVVERKAFGVAEVLGALFEEFERPDPPAK